jgi:uncharacterized membrane protein YfcA
MTGAVLAGFAAGVLTGAGIGGGTLLLVWLSNFGGLEQRQAQGINLLYFLLTAPPALYGHLKNGLVDKPLALRAGAAGVLAAAITAFLTADLDTELLRKAFGVFTVLVGLREVFCKKEE